MSISKTLFTANAIGNTAYGVTLGGSAMLFIDFLDDHSKAVGGIGIMLGLVIQWYFKRKSDKRAEEAHNLAMEKKNDT